MASSSKVAPAKFTRLIDIVDKSPQISFVLDDDLHLVYFNEAWKDFARTNGAPELAEAVGTDLRDVIGADLRPFYMRAFAEATREGKVWECLYECSSPELFRKFQMRIHPSAPAGSFLVTNSLVMEHPHHAVSKAPMAEYVDSNSLITVCMHCRCSRRSGSPDRWDFVPAHLDRWLRNVSHGLCPVCLNYFYPEEPWST